MTSANIAFTRRISKPILGRREAFLGRLFRRQPCEPNRVAAAPLGLKVLGFVNAGTLYETGAKIF